MTDVLDKYRELFLEQENVTRIGEKDFYNFIKIVNMEISNKQRYTIMQLVFVVIDTDLSFADKIIKED